MNILSAIFFVIFLVTTVTAMIMTFLFRKKECSFYDLWIHGRFITRYLSKYVEAKYVRPINILNYIGISCLLLCVAGILFEIFFLL